MFTERKKLSFRSKPSHLIYPKRLFLYLAMILSLPIAKHSVNLIGFKQCLHCTLNKYTWVLCQTRKKRFSQHPACSPIIWTPVLSP